MRKRVIKFIAVGLFLTVLVFNGKSNQLDNSTSEFVLKNAIALSYAVKSENVVTCYSTYTTNIFGGGKYHVYICGNCEQKAVKSYHDPGICVYGN